MSFFDVGSMCCNTKYAKASGLVSHINRMYIFDFGSHFCARSPFCNSVCFLISVLSLASRLSVMDLPPSYHVMANIEILIPIYKNYADSTKFLSDISQGSQESVPSSATPTTEQKRKRPRLDPTVESVLLILYNISCIVVPQLGSTH